ncbi:MAG: cadmium-translocating P-type ATPase [Propionibacteriaceae bacterium]|jgi:heavy metal translocating P-type ATPase|nr:cadmium-translocating P-type ATPase [Propionibacteriaceae bacterium]
MRDVLARVEPTDLVRLGLVAACLIVTLAGFTAPSPRLPLVALVGLVVGCWPLVRESAAQLGHRQMSMELSMLVAIAAAAAVGEWVTALLVTAFALAAEILEDLSMDRGRDALSDLMAFLPTTVRVRRDGVIASVEAAELEPGDLVVVGPGEAIPVDGVVEDGQSSVDQSRLTGESLPVDVAPGSAVYAGCVNHLGLLDIRADRVGESSSFGQIVQAVRSAQSVESPTQRLGDRVAGWLVGFAVVAGVVNFALTRDVASSLSLVIVAGACGIAAGTPLAVLGALGRAARHGAFIRGGVHLENLAGIDTVVFDKTGTLTEGRLDIVAAHTAPGWDESELLRLAASAEAGSEHPVGQALVRRAVAAGLPVAASESFDYQPGRGLSATVEGRAVRVGNHDLIPEAVDHHSESEHGQGTTHIHVAVGDQFAGTFVLADVVRESSADAVRELEQLGLRTVLLTGDAASTGQAIGRQLGIDEVRAQLFPEQKLAAIQAEKAAGRRLAMVGDGVNDAPALAVADVGIAMGSGTEVARRSADIVLISSDLADLVRLVRLARRMRRIVWTNLVGTIIVDLAGMALAALGVIGPVAAAVIHVVSEAAFILNSARLTPIGKA